MSSRPLLGLSCAILLGSANLPLLAIAASPAHADDDGDAQSDGGNKRTFIEGGAMGSAAPAPEDDNSDPSTTDRGTMDPGGGHTDDGGDADPVTP